MSLVDLLKDNRFKELEDLLSLTAQAFVFNSEPQNVKALNGGTYDYSKSYHEIKPYTFDLLDALEKEGSVEVEWERVCNALLDWFGPKFGETVKKGLHLWGDKIAKKKRESHNSRKIHLVGKEETLVLFPDLLKYAREFVRNAATEYEHRLDQANPFLGVTKLQYLSLVGLVKLCKERYLNPVAY